MQSHDAHNENRKKIDQAQCNWKEVETLAGRTSRLGKTIDRKRRDRHTQRTHRDKPTDRHVDPNKSSKDQNKYQENKTETRNQSIGRPNRQIGEAPGTTNQAQKRGMRWLGLELTKPYRNEARVRRGISSKTLSAQCGMAAISSERGRRRGRGC